MKTNTTDIFEKIKVGDTAYVQAYIDEGHDINLRSSDNEKVPILSYAIGRLSDTSIPRMLISAGADLNSVDSENDTPIISAVYCKKYGIAEYLISLGADVNMVNDNGLSPLHYAVRNQDIELVRLIALTGSREEYAGKNFVVNLDVYDNEDDTPIIDTFFYTEKGLEMFEFLLSEGANPNSTDSCNVSLLRKACINERPDCVQALINHGKIDVNMADDKGQTALMTAASVSHESGIESVTILLESGADALAINSDGKNVLDLDWTTDAARSVISAFLVKNEVNKGSDSKTAPPPMKRF